MVFICFSKIVALLDVPLTPASRQIFFIALVLIIHIHILQHNHVLAPGICSCWSQENRKTTYKLKYVDLM